MPLEPPKRVQNKGWYPAVDGHSPVNESSLRHTLGLGTLGYHNAVGRRDDPCAPGCGAQGKFGSTTARLTTLYPCFSESDKMFQRVERGVDSR